MELRKHTFADAGVAGILFECVWLANWGPRDTDPRTIDLGKEGVLSIGPHAHTRFAGARERPETQWKRMWQTLVGVAQSVMRGSKNRS